MQSERARAEALGIIAHEQARMRGLPSRYVDQTTQLTVPATRWKMVEAATTRGEASLVMLDLEDSIPRQDPGLLEEGRQNVVRALTDLDWGTSLRFFRPRGLELDPGCDDLRVVVSAAGKRLEGIVLPKVECADEVQHVAAVLDALEREAGCTAGAIAISVLIESAAAEERAFEIAQSSPRVVSLVFGAYDYWSSLGMGFVPYRFDHKLVDEARMRISKAAASVGVAAIAEMSTNYPTKDKSEEQRALALAECRRDAAHAQELGMRGKWVGHPGQVATVREVFRPQASAVEQAVSRVRAFAEAEQSGLGAIMIDGRMSDRATDRVDRTTLTMALGYGMLDARVAEALGITSRK